MISFSPLLKIYLHREPIDMRKSYDGLFGIVKNDLAMDVRNGGLFMFINLKRNRVKLMYWDKDGIAIWQKNQESEDTHSNTFTGIELLKWTPIIGPRA